LKDTSTAAFDLIHHADPSFSPWMITQVAVPSWRYRSHCDLFTRLLIWQRE